MSSQKIRFHALQKHFLPQAEANFDICRLHGLLNISSSSDFLSNQRINSVTPTSVWVNEKYSRKFPREYLVKQKNLKRISLKMLICVFLSAKFFRCANGNLSRTFSEINESSLTGNVFKIKRSQWPTILLFIAVAATWCEWINCNWLTELLPLHQPCSEHSVDALRKFNEGKHCLWNFRVAPTLAVDLSRFFTLQIRPQLSWKAFKQIYLFVWRRNEKIFAG